MLQNFDRGRYDRIFDKAITNVREVYDAQSSPESHRYVQHITLPVDRAPGGFTTEPIRCFIREVFRFAGFEVRFVSWRRPAPAPQPGVVPLRGFVSWLFPDFTKKTVLIAYNELAITDVVPTQAFAEDGEDPIDRACRLILDSGLISTYEKILSKVFLHEAGHFSCHRKKYADRIAALGQNGTQQVAMDPEDEADAWLYALVVWGVLTGDHSYDARANDNDPDYGYYIC